MIKAVIVSMTVVVLLSGLRPPSALAASLLLATDDTLRQPVDHGWWLPISKKLPGLEIELYRLIAEIKKSESFKTLLGRHTR